MTTPVPMTTASIIPFPKHQPGKYAYCGLSIDLGSLKHNFATLQAALGTSICSAVVKADAYGLGIAPCTKALYEAGCRHFFVAYLDEALDLKHILPARDVKIYVLNGFMKGQEEEFLYNDFIPVLTDIEKVERWAFFAKEDPLPAVLHIDTGMNRTGLRFDRMHHHVLDESLSRLNVQIVMSHLACAEDISNEFNEVQRKRFVNAVKQLRLSYKPQLSLANSGAIVLGSDYHYDIARPGIALYGCTASRSLPLKTTLRLWSRIYQIQTVPAHESIGYGRSYFTDADRKIATITLGYADGFSWKAGTMQHHPFVMVGKFKAPIVGRISMDLITIDITDVPSEYVYEGAVVDILNNDITVNHLAKWTATLPLEVILKFGNRLEKSYTES